jgi:hypothetical protein
MNRSAASKGEAKSSEGWLAQAMHSSTCVEKKEIRLEWSFSLLWNCSVQQSKS